MGGIIIFDQIFVDRSKFRKVVGRVAGLRSCTSSGGKAGSGFDEGVLRFVAREFTQFLRAFSCPRGTCKFPLVSCTFVPDDCLVGRFLFLSSHGIKNQAIYYVDYLRR